MFPQPTNRICAECGKPVLLLDRTVIVEDGSPNPVTKSTFGCSDAACREESARKEAQRREQALARRNRGRPPAPSAETVSGS